MARIFPHALPESATPGERVMLNILRRLDDDCFVYFEPGISNRRPDFVVIMPGTALLVIEVKDWALSSIREATPHKITFAGMHGPIVLPHPEIQARNYAFRLADLCRSDPIGRTLIQATGPHQGKLCFPVAWIAAYHNISRLAFDEAGLSACFPVARNITSDLLSKWRRMDAATLRAELTRHFDPWWPHDMPQERIEALTALIYPARVGTPAGDADASELHILDERQRELAFFTGVGHRVLRGISGSGKTVILISRARYLAEDPDARILLLTYNRLLRDYIAEQLKACRNVAVRTFDGWCARNGVDFRQHEPGTDLGPVLRRKLEAGEAPDAARFGHVLVDEAQLMSCDWLVCARLALKERDPRKASLFIAADGAQSLRRLIPFTWKDAGVAALGRTTILSENYRNTREILSVAEAMLSLSDDVDGPRDAPTVDPAKARRHGPLPELHPLPDRTRECAYAAQLIKLWRVGGRSIRGRLVKPRPEDIAIIYPYRAPEVKDFAARLKRALDPIPVAVLSGEEPARLSEPGVRVMSMKKSPGLQFRFVILLWSDLLPTPFPDDDARALLYMAMTRAEDVLVILYSGGSELVSRIGAALETNGAPALG